jgi:hypothetical protein
MVAAMHVAGLRVASRSAKWVATVVIMEESGRDVAEQIEHICNKSHDDATQARELRDTLNGALSPYDDIAAVVLFEADYSDRSKITRGVKERLRLEGAALTACLDHARRVDVMNGPAIGRACGCSKDEALASAAELPVIGKYVDAAAAAIAARSLL